MAKAYGRDLSMSTKYSVEICNSLRGLPLDKAKKKLEGIITLKEPLYVSKHNKDTAHKKGMAAGKYPVKTATQILGVLKNAEANAQNKGLSSNDSVIVHICAHKAATPWHFGRKRRRKMKRTNLEVVLAEKPKKEEPDKVKK